MRLKKRMTASFVNKHIFIMRVNKQKNEDLKILYTISLNIRASYHAKLSEPKLIVEINVEAIDVQ